MTLWGGLQDRLLSPISELAFGLLVTLLMVYYYCTSRLDGLAPINRS